MNSGSIEPPLEGMVVKKNKEFYEVKSGLRMVSCTLAARLRKELSGVIPAAGARQRTQADRHAFEHIDPLAVGDVVRYHPDGNGSGMIVELLPRRNYLARPGPAPMPGAHQFEQVIVANLDQVVPVFAVAEPPPRWNLLDRYLVAAESFGLPALVCVTKLDLALDGNGRIDPQLDEAVADYRRIGYPVVLASAFSGAGLDELRQALRGRLSVFLGKSGVGKTSLLNALQPGLGLRVREVSQLTGKGRHTTTAMELFPLDFGGSIVDTPGIREFGLWGVDFEDLPHFFPEMRPFIGRCRFGLDCIHDDEPGCAVRKAVMEGMMSPRRYQSYLRLREDL